MSWEHEEAHELVLYADNDARLWAMQEPYVENMRKRIKAGTYNLEKGIKLWMYYVERAAKSYVREHGSMSDKWNRMFPMTSRREAAEHYARKVWGEIRRGERDPSRLIRRTKY